MPSFADKRLICIGQRHDKRMNIRRARGGFNFLLRCLRASVAEIIADRVVKEIRFLRDDADMRAQRVYVHVSYVGAVDTDTALLGIVEAGEELHGRRFPTPGKADG